MHRFGLTVVIAFAVQTLLLAVMAPAGQCPEPETLWAWGPPHAVATDGELAFTASGSMLVVSEVSRSGALSLVSVTELVAEPESLELAGDLLLAACGRSGLLIISVADPRQPAVVATASFSGAVLDVAPAASLACVAVAGEDQTTPGRLVTVDLSDLEHPLQLGAYLTSALPSALAVAGETVVIPSADGLDLVDISEPSQPRRIGELDEVEPIVNVETQGERLFLTTFVQGGWESWTGFKVFDISNPDNLVPLGTWSEMGVPVALDVAGDRAYLLDICEPRVLDISDLRSPEILIDLETIDSHYYPLLDQTGCVTDLAALDSGILVTSDRYGLRQIQVDSIGRYSIPGALPLPYRVGDTALHGNHLLVSSVSSEIEVYDVSDPAQPAHVGGITLPGNIGSMTMAGDLLLVAAREAGLVVINAADPEDLSELGSLATSGDAHFVAASGTTVYVAADQLQAVSLDEPTTPALVTTIDVTGRLAVAEALLVVASEDSLELLDLTDPRSPVRVGSLAMAAPGWSVAVSGATALVAVPGGLELVDISAPAAPRLAATYPTSSYWNLVEVAGETAYLVEIEQQMVHLLDISDHAHPVPLAVRPSLGLIVELVVAEDLAFSAEVEDTTASESLLRPYSLSPPNLMHDISALHLPLEVTSVAFDSRGTTYIGTSYEGVRVLPSEPISDHEIPPVALALASDGWLDPRPQIAATRRHLLVAGDTLRIFEPLEDGSLRVVGELPIPFYEMLTTTEGRRLIVTETTAYVTTAEGLVTVDIADVSEPRQLGTFVQQVVRDIEVAGSTAYLASGYDGLIIVDVADRSMPVEVASIPIPSRLMGVAVSQELAFVTALDEGLLVSDVSNPATPVHLTTVEIEGSATAVAATADLAIVGTRSGEVLFVDTADPSHPVVVSSASCPGSVSGITIAKGRAWVMSSGWGREVRPGVKVFDLSWCASTPPVAGFSWLPETPHPGDSVSFSDSSSGLVTSWYWELGDGSTSTEPDPIHTYRQSGTFQVRLTVGNGAGTSSVSQLIKVEREVRRRPRRHY